jgi:hypothetical protein
MTRAFVLGNGVSRQGVNLHQLRHLGKIYGCNALYREFTPDVLIATDKPIAEQIQNSGYSQQHRFYTRKPIGGLGALPLDKKYYGYSSGPNAVGVAVQDGHRLVYLVGFDMGPTEDNTFNNMYADTEFYKKIGSNPTYTGNWIKQLLTVMSDYPFTQFIRVYGKTTAKIPELESVPNLEHLDLATFLDRINNQKDL